MTRTQPSGLPGRSIDPDDYQRLGAPIAVMAKRYPSGFLIEPHHHVRHQLLFAVAGVMVVSTARQSWVVPPDRALFVPAGVAHSVSVRRELEMRTLYLRKGLRALSRLSPEPAVLAVSELMRALIGALIDEPVDYPRASRGQRLADLLIDEITRAPALNLSLPRPADVRLRRLCEAVLEDPGRPWTLDRWAEHVGASTRHLSRLFERDLQMSFRMWRARVRFHHAIEGLVAGTAVAEVAHAHGYRSVSAFTAAFRAAIGQSPSSFAGAKHRVGRPGSAA